MATVTKITFEDHGQDFSEWYVRDGIVIDCQPHQGRFWVGTRLEYPAGPLVEGGSVHYRSSNSGELLYLKYPIEAIDVLSSAEAAEVEGYGIKWASMKGIQPAALGLNPQ